MEIQKNKKQSLNSKDLDKLIESIKNGKNIIKHNFFQTILTFLQSKDIQEVEKGIAVLQKIIDAIPELKEGFEDKNGGMNLYSDFNQALKECNSEKVKELLEKLL